METEFISNSQAGQDLWVKAMLIDSGTVTRGTFLDVGANHPIQLSNTFALERAGWRGLLVDNDVPVMELCQTIRPRTPFWRVDATTVNWSGLLPAVFRVGELIDYLSLDVDQATPLALKGLLDSGYRFRIATIEHDAYRFGQLPRDTMREMMTDRGYQLICKDVRHDNCEFEDWWADPMLVDRALIRKFTCDSMDGLEIVKP